MASTDFQLTGCFFCDDIRDEKSLQSTVVGVYPHEIQVAKFPWKKRFFLFVTFRWSGRVATSFQLRVRLNDEPKEKFAEVKIESEHSDLFGFSQSVNLKGPMIDVVEPCIISVDGKVEDEEWCEIGRVAIASLSSTDPAP